jgi:hypothetical protein
MTMAAPSRSVNLPTCLRATLTAVHVLVLSEGVPKSGTQLAVQRTLCNMIGSHGPIRNRAQLTYLLTPVHIYGK